MRVTGTRTAAKRALRNRQGFRWLSLTAGLLSLVVAGLPMASANATVPFAITTSPALSPSFSPLIHDYVVSCSRVPTTTLTTTGSGVTVVGDLSLLSPLRVSMPLVANQEVNVSYGGHIFHIRCLPADFPAYNAVISGPAQSQGYLVTPMSFVPALSSNYTVSFDNFGVPVWWFRDDTQPVNATYFQGTTPQIGWFTGKSLGPQGTFTGSFTMRNLAGRVVSTIGDQTAGTAIDAHDFQRLENGDFLAIQYSSATANLSSWGLSTTTPILDCSILEINPSGQIVWRWSANAHINIASANMNFRTSVPDVFHMNSVQIFNGTVYVSFRHLDAVYAISKTTGAILWKLGGSSTPQSLSVIGNSYPAVFSGQHDARMRPDGSLSVHDNATNDPSMLPRVLRFVVHPLAKTAKIVEQVTDPLLTTGSACCGSATKVNGGNWVVAWGGSPVVAEVTPTGKSVVRITFPNRLSYRATSSAPVAWLRAGMDAQFPPLHLKSARSRTKH